MSTNNQNFASAFSAQTGTSFPLLTHVATQAFSKREFGWSVPELIEFKRFYPIVGEAVGASSAMRWGTAPVPGEMHFYENQMGVTKVEISGGYCAKKNPILSKLVPKEVQNWVRGEIMLQSMWYEGIPVNTSIYIKPSGFEAYEVAGYSESNGIYYCRESFTEWLGSSFKSLYKKIASKFTPSAPQDVNVMLLEIPVQKTIFDKDAGAAYAMELGEYVKISLMQERARQQMEDLNADIFYNCEHKEESTIAFDAKFTGSYGSHATRTGIQNVYNNSLNLSTYSDADFYRLDLLCEVQASFVLNLTGTTSIRWNGATYETLLDVNLPTIGSVSIDGSKVRPNKNYASSLLKLRSNPKTHNSQSFDQFMDELTRSTPSCAMTCSYDFSTGSYTFDLPGGFDSRIYGSKYGCVPEKSIIHYIEFGQSNGFTCEITGSPNPLIYSRIAKVPVNDAIYHWMTHGKPEMIVPVDFNPKLYRLINPGHGDALEEFVTHGGKYSLRDEYVAIFNTEPSIVDQCNFAEAINHKKNPKRRVSKIVELIASKIPDGFEVNFAQRVEFCLDR